MITIALVIITLLVLAGFVLYTRTTVLAKSTGTYVTKVIDKLEKQTVIYTGVFIPMTLYSIKTSENLEMQIERNQYDRINVGDTVTIASYSNGLHKLQP